MSAEADPTTGDPGEAPDQPERLREFEAELARLRVTGTSATGEQRFLLAGIVLMPLGLVLVLAGWFGASGTTEFSSQVPYLLSGGVLGLGCTVIGAALYLRHSLARYLRFWLLRLVYEERAASDRNVEALGKLGEILVRSSKTDPTVTETAREKEIQP